MAHFTIAGLVTRSALSKPATRRYPFVKRQPYANTRGSIVIDIEKCSMCTLCQKRCPTEAIEVKRAEKIWSIDRLRCIQCGACAEACPKNCLTMNNQYSPAAVTREINVFKQAAGSVPAADAAKN